MQRSGTRALLASFGIVAAAVGGGTAAPAAASVALAPVSLTDFVGLVHVSTDGRFVLTLAAPGAGSLHVRQADLSTGRVRDLTDEGLLPDAQQLGAASVSGDGRFVMTGTARVDLATGEVLQPDLSAAASVLGAPAFAITPSRDGRFAVALFARGLARIDVRTGAFVRLPGTQPLAISPGGRYVVTWSCPEPACPASGLAVGTARVVDAATGSVLGTFPSTSTQGSMPATAVDDRGRYVDARDFGDAVLVDPARGSRTPLGPSSFQPVGSPDPYSDDLDARAAVAGFGVTAVVRTADRWRWTVEDRVGGALLSGDGSTLVTLEDGVGSSSARLVPHTGTFAPRAKPLRGLQVLRVPSVYLPPAPVRDLNVTVTEPDDAGYLRVWNCDEPMPATSNLNFDRGETVANHVLVTEGVGGICFYANVSAELVVDAGGTLSPSGPYRGLAPARLVDTRLPGSGVVRSAAGTELSVVVAGGTSGVPADARAVVLNVTATGASAPGYVTAWPCGKPRPLVSSVNVDAGQTRAALVTVAPGDGGRVCLASNVQLDMVVDRSGAFDATAPLSDIDPARLLDTRTAGETGPPALPAGTVTAVRVAPPAPYEDGFRTALLNVTVTNPASGLFVTAWVCGNDRPTTSVLNAPADATRSNSLAAPVGQDGTVCLYTSAPADLVVDRFGLYTDTVHPWWVPVPERLVDTRNW